MVTTITSPRGEISTETISLPTTTSDSNNRSTKMGSTATTEGSINFKNKRPIVLPRPPIPAPPTPTRFSGMHVLVKETTYF